FRIGEFVITLNGPNYSDAADVQRHLVYSTILSSVLSSDLKDKTGDHCGAVVTPSRFPDLRVFLFVNQSLGATDEDRSFCRRYLQDAILDSHPSKDLIDKIAASTTELKVLKTSNPHDVVNYALGVLDNALRRIYDIDTVMYALISIEPETFRSLDA